MIVQISSGQGPAECELAVKKLYEALEKEYQDIQFLSAHQSRMNKDGYTSIMFSTKCDMSELEGSILWRCKSPYRPHHGRKNWFVDVSIIPERNQIPKDEDIRWERFHSSGKGGQNVNKVETGVRLIHIPTGITVTSTAERSQYLNKRDAMQKLNAQLQLLEMEEMKKQKNSAWREHNRIIRGNPVRIYEGEKFKLVYKENEGRTNCK